MTWSNASYGPNYYQTTTSLGTGADPTFEWEDLGVWLPGGTKIKRIHIALRINNAEVTDLELYWALRGGDTAARWETGLDNDSEISVTDVYRGKFWNNTDEGQPTFSGNLQDIHRRTFDVNVIVPAGGAYLDQCMKPEGTLTTTRYGWWTSTIEVVLPPT